MLQLPLPVFISIIITAFISGSCEVQKAENDGPKKLKAYQVKIKKSDIDFPFQEEDCSKIPAHPCYCVDTIALDTTILTAYIKNCGDSGVAENIDVKTTLYPTSRPAIEMNSLAINPDTLAQDSSHIFAFTTGTNYSVIDSVVFEVEYNWEGERTARRDTTVSRVKCNISCN